MSSTNVLLTPTVIANELLMRFKNNLVFTELCSHEYDERFAKSGGKIGDTLKLRVPNRYLAVSGAPISEQDTTEASVNLTIDTQMHTAFSFLSKDMTLTIDQFGDRYLDSAAVALANACDVSGLTMATQSTANVVGAPGTVPSTLLTYLQAGQKLSENAAPVDNNRSIVVNPAMEVGIVDALKTLYQSSTEIDKQYKRGRMGTAAGFTWAMDQNIRTQTVGPLGGAPQTTVAGQTGSTLLTTGWTAAVAPRVKKGDVFTILGVYAVNPVSGDTLAALKQFVVTADTSSLVSGDLSLPISPAIVATGPNKNVSAAPGAGAALTFLGTANTLSPQGIAFHKEAFCFAMVPLEQPQGVHMAKVATDPKTGLSIRFVSAYDISTDRFITRADVMYGWAARNPAWACRIAS
jgi:hypothetical protein